MISASEPKTASADAGRMVSEPPELSWTRAPIHSASSGPPIQTFVTMNAISAASDTRFSHGSIVRIR